MKPKKLKRKLTRYYELDIDNCAMSHESQVDELTRALTNPKKYLKNFKKEFKDYNKELSA